MTADAAPRTGEQPCDLVWLEPMQRRAKQIGIIDVAIAKHCRKSGAPVPERGYWNKRQVGKPVTKKRTRLKFLSANSNRSVAKKDRHRNQANSWPSGNGTCKR
jgi:hypothetical protein